MIKKLVEYLQIISSLALFSSLLINTALAAQSNSITIENTNLAFKRCMKNAPVVETIKQCDNANACWAKWLSQYEQAKYHEIECIKAHGGNDYSYHYVNTKKLNNLAQQY